MWDVVAPEPSAGKLVRFADHDENEGFPSRLSVTEDFAPAPFAGRKLLCRRGERLVFRHLDFDLAPGGVLLLRGPNGSGKSSLLRLMAGLLRPGRGRASLGGGSRSTTSPSAIAGAWPSSAISMP